MTCDVVPESLNLLRAVLSLSSQRFRFLHTEYYFEDIDFFLLLVRSLMSQLRIGKTLKCTDEGHLFWIHGLPGILGCSRIRERVNPDAVMKKSDYNDATAFFIESRNVGKVPSRLDGVLCAVYLQDYNLNPK